MSNFAQLQMFVIIDTLQTYSNLYYKYFIHHVASIRIYQTTFRKWQNTGWQTFSGEVVDSSILLPAGTENVVWIAIKKRPLNIRSKQKTAADKSHLREWTFEPLKLQSRFERTSLLKLLNLQFNYYSNRTCRGR